MKQIDAFEAPIGRNPNCKLCDLHKGQPTVCVWGVGPTKAKVMIVGEAPGEREAQLGKPFQGRSGQLLREELRKVGISEDEVYITNTVKCRPPDNRTPKVKEQKACRAYLDAEIASVKPKFILTLGNPATKAIFKRAKITEVHGQILSTDDGIVGMPAFHPAYMLRDIGKLPVFRKDLQRFAAEMKGIRRKTSIDWEVVTPGNIDVFLSELHKSNYFSFDIETNGLFPFHKRRGKLTCISFCVDSTYKSWVVPLNMPGSPWVGYERQREILQSIRTVARGKKGVGQFAKFDNIFLNEKYGLKFPLHFDTGLAHHTLDENANHDLKGLATFYFDAPHYDLSTKEKQGHVEPMKLYRYGAKDAFYTLKLKDVFVPMLEKDPMVKRLFYRLVMRASRAFFHVDSNGLFINRERFDASEKKVRIDLEETLGELNSLVRKKRKDPVNWSSPDQVADVLFNTFGLEPVEFTPTGKPSTAEATLVELKDKHPVANLLVKYRELEKFLGTYIEGWKEFMANGRVYFSTKIHGTVTGRYSSRLHQTPRNGTIRNVVDAPDGWTFVQGDFSQAELIIAAIASRDPELIRCFKEGIDVHWRTLLAVVLSGGGGEYVQPVRDTAYKLLLERNKLTKRPGLTDAVELLLKAGHDKCIELWKGWKEGRKKAKGINFGFVYGMREEKFIEYAKIKYGFEPTMEEAETIRSAYFNLYRGLAPWHERQRKLVAVDGHVRNLAGRLRRLPGIRSKDRSMRSECERQAINSPIQGFIGDIKAMALVELVETLDRDDARVVGEVHDSILFEVRTEVLDRELRKIERIMMKPALLEEFNIRLPIQLKTELEVGPWGAGKKWSSQ